MVAGISNKEPNARTVQNAKHHNPTVQNLSPKHTTQGQGVGRWQVAGGGRHGTIQVRQEEGGEHGGQVW